MTEQSVTVAIISLIHSVKTVMAQTTFPHSIHMRNTKN